MNRYLTKAAVTLKRPEGITFSMLKFQPATEVEIAEVNKAQGADIPDGYVAGWASTPDLDLYRHVVKTGAFDDAIKDRGLSGPKSIKLLLGHDWDKVTGVIRVLETRQKKLWIEAQLNLNISYARDAYEAMKMAGGFNFSVGFMLQDYAFKEDDNKREYLYIERGDLFEVSIVPFPGNEEATMDIVKSREHLATIEAQKKALEDKKREDEEDNDDPLPALPANEVQFKTVAEFEKSLKASGLVKCRRDAKRITQIVKCATHLFKAEDPNEDNKQTEPVLAAASLAEVSTLLAKMRDLLAPVAK